VQALGSTNYAINLFNGANNGGTVAGDSFHMLVAYQVQGAATPTVDIMDLAVEISANKLINTHTLTSDGSVHLFGSDIVQLTGVTLSHLTAANFHLVA
jgi:hypothetical protein